MSNDRKFIKLYNVAMPLGIFLLIVAGIIFWIASRWISSIFQPLYEAIPRLAVIAINASLEEILRALIAVSTLFYLSRFGYGKKFMLFGILASLMFAILENIDYLTAFPSSDIYARAGYSSLIHVNNAAAMALALSGPFTKIKTLPATAAITFFSCLAWHFIFNTIADSRYVDSFSAFGIILNCAVLLALFFWSEAINFYKEEINERN